MYDYLNKWLHYKTQALLLTLHCLINFQAFVDKIRKSVDEYPRLFVFAVDNMRNTHFQQVRDSWKTHSTFFLGKNRVMALALGRNESEEYSDKVSSFITNSSDVFTNFSANFPLFEQLKKKTNFFLVKNSLFSKFSYGV